MWQHFKAVCTSVQADLSQPTYTGIKRVQRFMVNPCLAQASLICHTVKYIVQNYTVYITTLYPWWQLSVVSEFANIVCIDSDAVSSQTTIYMP